MAFRLVHYEVNADATKPKHLTGDIPMKFFVDTADIDQIKELHAYGMVDGVTTNPSIIAKSGLNILEVTKEICSITDGPVSAEVVALDRKSTADMGWFADM
jgi:transaldolase